MPRPMISITGTQLLIQDLRKLGAEFDMQLKLNVKAATLKVFHRVKKNINLNDHTIKQLAAMGHPYSAVNPQQIHTPEYLVHKQTGELRRAVEHGVIQEGDETIGFVRVNEDKAPYARWVVMGTTKMVGRDFLSGTMDELRDKVYDEIRKGLRQVIIRRTI